jgi:hypothetical protein
LEVGISELLKNNTVSSLNYTTTINTDGKEEKLSISRADLKAKISYEKENPLTVNIVIKGKGEITEVGNINVKVTNELVKQADRNFEKEIKGLVSETVKKMQNKNIEPWLIGHRLWAMDPDFFDTLKWDETGWREANVNVTVDFTIKHTGQKGYLGKRKIGR